MAHAEQHLMDRLRAGRVGEAAGRHTTFSTPRASDTRPPDVRQLYFGLLEEHPTAAVLEHAREFLRQQLEAVSMGECDLPPDLTHLPTWVRTQTIAVGEQYGEYLAGRQAGAGRRFFRSKSHALHFLRGVAPTKLVDGAWLYGVVSQWRDPRYADLLRTYLEELGDGQPELNHVVLYRQLLATQECGHWQDLEDSHFLQGAIQLSLAWHAAEFLPEVIGFNLGYEQLPLHLPITAYELNELGIDPHYFTLHITIDNAASGHAARAAQAVLDAMPRVGDKAAFQQRIREGYRLNDLGAGTHEVINGFDIDRELLAVLEAKAPAGAHLHSDYCRLEGKTVNQWLAEPGQMPGFVAALEKAGWLRRHEPVENSRFWTLLVGDKAPMFGVFNAYERQLIHDWIAGDSLPTTCAPKDSYRHQHARLARERHASSALSKSGNGPHRGPAWKPGLGYWHGSAEDFRPSDDFNEDARRLRHALAQAADGSAAMDMLVPLLSPTHHHTAAGLLATRMFVQGLRA